VQYSAVQCSAVQCSAVQCSAVQCSAVQSGAEQCSAVNCDGLHCGGPDVGSSAKHFFKVEALMTSSENSFILGPLLSQLSQLHNFTTNT
jgi:hypothetical protein